MASFSPTPSRDELTPTLIVLMAVDDEDRNMGMVQTAKQILQQGEILDSVRTPDLVPLNIHPCGCTDPVKHIAETSRPRAAGTCRRHGGQGGRAGQSVRCTKETWHFFLCTEFHSIPEVSW